MCCFFLGGFHFTEILLVQRVLKVVRDSGERIRQKICCIDSLDATISNPWSSRKTPEGWSAEAKAIHELGKTFQSTEKKGNLIFHVPIRPMGLVDLPTFNIKIKHM